MASSRLIYVIFLLSGVSGLIYQVVWVRWFGRLFGNTVYSAALVIAVFMCGLGVGSYLAGAWIDRHHRQRPKLALKAYGYFELAIALLGGLVALALPALEPLSGMFSAYTEGANGWYELSALSLAFRFAIATIVLSPITILMGGTLTLLVRHLLREDTQLAGWRIGMLYGFNTAGAALGAFATDFVLIPGLGLLATQMMAVMLNLVAALGAFHLLKHIAPVANDSAEPSPAARSTLGMAPRGSASITWTGIAIGLSGFSAIGVEILWFRHFSIALGAYRAVFSLLLTVVLIGIWFGSAAGGYCHRRFGRPALLYMISQTAFVSLSLFLLAIVDFERGSTTFDIDALGSSWMDRLTITWGVLKPIILVVGLPAFLMGFAYPLANANVQLATQHVGRRAGLLYLANTLGAVLGSVCAGFFLLPVLGMKGGLLCLALVGAGSVAALFWAAPRRPRRVGGTYVFAGCAVCLMVSISLWWRVPNARFTSFGIEKGETLITVSEGVSELVAVTEAADGSWRKLKTNGHAMSGNEILAQRYMRAFVHLPLLHMDDASDVLVICFGVGSTLHAASLHSSLKRIEIADLSRNVLEHARYFRSSNHDVLSDPRVKVFVNDGRQHLWMQPEERYDLITLEPPPLPFAGVSSLYSREFYELARSRLREGGFMSQWLPAYQLPAAAVRSMVRAFLDAFPNAVLLSGHRKELILLGGRGPEFTIDPARVQARLESDPAIRADLQRIHLGTLTEIIGTFVSSSTVLDAAAKDVLPVTDDYPIMEYSAPPTNCSRTHFPPELIDLSGISSWCPACLSNGEPVPEVGPLGAYGLFMDHYYRSEDFLIHDSCPVPRKGTRLPISRKNPVFEETTYLSTMLEPVQ